MRRLVLLAVLLAGCGGSDAEPVAERAAAPRWAARDCTVLADYRVCYHSDRSGRSRRAIEYRHETVWKRLRVPPPMHVHGQPLVGHWTWVAESPDGAWLLAQWSAECEVPVAFLVPAAGGAARAVARDRYGPATSIALGWTSDGRAIVELPAFECGGKPTRPGVYLIAPDTGEREFWRRPGAVQPSLSPRDVS